MAASTFASFSPIDRSLGNLASRKYLGDQLTRAHAILRDGSTTSTVPPVSETTGLVIIGGGLGGLFSTYLLRAHKPVLLEQASRFGGMAKGQSWRGNDFALGAAYFCYAEDDDPRQLLYKELGLDRIYKLKEEEDPVLYSGRVYRNFWDGGTAPGQETQFKKLGEYFKAVYNEENDQRYPEIPFDAEEDASFTQYITDLDRMSFRQLVEKVAGEELHSHIEAALQHYCWSSMGASIDEISAASGLNFYAAEFGGLYVTPGGNAGAAEQVLRRICESGVPESNLRPESVVFNVEVVGDGVHVSYLGPSGAKTIKAKAVVMACPKYVAKHILRGIEPERSAAIEKLNYRSYLVANVLLRGGLSPENNFYDMYMLQNGQVDSTNIEAAAMEHGFQDTLNGVYAHLDPEHTVLTLYQGLPFDGARAALEDDAGYEKRRLSFENQVEAQVLPILGFKKTDIVDTRVARWGHALPVAGVGMIADGVVDQLRRPFKDRVFFVNQDNWALPAFETCLGEAMNWKDAVDRAAKTG